METIRVSRGGEYYYLHHNYLSICVDCDFRNTIDDNRYEIGNYFRTKQEAETMACKIRAILNGADVIEMPSEEDASFESVHHLRLSGHDDRDRREEAHLGRIRNEQITMKKKYYTPLTMESIHVKSEGSFLAASVETKTKDFNVTTGNYEVSTENWYSNNPTFDNPSF